MLTLSSGQEQDPLRTTHQVFKDTAFCGALAAQIRRRLVSIATNWREGQTIECLVVLLQRVWSLASSASSIEEARGLLLDVRKMAHGWTRLLRREICNATDVETAQKRYVSPQTILLGGCEYCRLR